MLRMELEPLSFSILIVILFLVMFLIQLTETITEAGENDKVKVIILRSWGERAFCAGASFDELISIEDENQGKQFFSGFANFINAARKCPKFIIGRVQGKAVGGGVGYGFCYGLLLRHQICIRQTQ